MHLWRINFKLIKCSVQDTCYNLRKPIPRRWLSQEHTFIVRKITTSSHVPRGTCFRRRRSCQLQKRPRKLSRIRRGPLQAPMAGYEILKKKKYKNKPVINSGDESRHFVPPVRSSDKIIETGLFDLEEKKTNLLSGSNQSSSA